MKVSEVLKKNKIPATIVGILLMLIIGMIVYFIAFKGNKTVEENIDNNKESEIQEDKVIAPAENTEVLLETLEEVEIEEVNSDEISFSDSVNLTEGEKVAVWVYSEPKFLGYFEVIIENGKKKIEGLEKALKNITVESGNHNFAIVKEDGSSVGYIDIYIEENGNVKEETKEVVKTETKVEEIAFKTTKQNEVNLKSGVKEVAQMGVKGEKTIVYEVTYDKKGKEISRKKVSEKITKEPVEQIEKIGVSDFNINTDMLTEVSFGPACTEDQIITDSNGYKECDSQNYPNLPQYYAVKINNSYYITSIKENGTNILSSNLKATEESAMLKAMFKGTQYYFYMSAGGGQYEPLTQEICNEYNLSCGAW